ncbi:Ig-like domain-containing protein [Neptunicella marina]|uniref:Ig-like domain-containing protein n=1 Tax=Neptunicella marina TaxID=2125989 RepID=A0A8J6M2Q9_9ALTE|nr:Ig-like domain-containing protein [Neptunicella marina]MBC3764661.1 Ig-like domain-containing protein [Neptunicella marina]
MKAMLTKLIVLSLTSLLMACGGGGSLSREGGSNGGGNTGGDEVTYTISLSIVNSATSEPSTELTSATPLTVNATVTSSDDSSTQGKVVSFAFDDATLATFSVQNGRAVVGENGVASINLIVGEQSGAGLVTATLDANTSAEIAFNSSGSSQQSAQPSDMDFYASSLQLPSSGQDKIELIALVKNAQNVLMEGVEVSFSVSNGASLSEVQSLTTADGTARAKLSTINQPENRFVTVTATAGNTNILVRTLDIEVVGTEVQIGGPSSVVLGDEAPITVKLVNSDGVGIANQSVTVTAENGSIVSADTITDIDGNLNLTYQATSAGDDNIIATALNASASFPISVQEDDFRFTTVPSKDIPLGDTATLSVTWLKDNAPYPGGVVTFKSSRGQVTSSSQVTTDANGMAQMTVTADNAGVALISADGKEAGSDTVTVSARHTFEFVATDAYSIIVDATPDSVGPNGQTSTVTAVVRDINDNLVKDKVIDFRVDDVSGGTIASNSAKTDSKGIASTVFTSNAVTSNEFVQVHATVSDTPSVTDFTTLTVADRAFDISFGTGPLIQVPDDASYIKEFAVFVSDSDGNPVANAELSVSVSPEKFNQGGVFRKGSWTWSDIDEQYVTYLTPVTSCSNEDINDNGILDSGEDTNGDGFLTPGIVGIIQFKDNNNITDANGQATLVYRYPRAYAVWTDTIIKVFGSSQGSESAQSQRFTLAIAAEDITDLGKAPPANPYGSSTSCSNVN